MTSLTLCAHLMWGIKHGNIYLLLLNTVINSVFKVAGHIRINQLESNKKKLIVCSLLWHTAAKWFI